jgi:hypothetical protein
MQLLKQLMEMNTGETRIAVGLLNRAFSKWELDFDLSGHATDRSLDREKDVSLQEVVGAFIKLRDKYINHFTNDYNANAKSFTVVIKDREAALNIVVAFDFSRRNPTTGKYDAKCITIKRKPVDEFGLNLKGGAVAFV